MAEENTPKDPKQSAEANGSGGDDSAKKPAAKAPAAGNKKPAAEGDSKPAAKKKEKPPAPEDKPFPNFITEEFIPALSEALKKEGLDDIDLDFERTKLEVVGSEQSGFFWQVIGHWQGGRRQFNVAFLKEDIKGPKLFAYSDSGSKPSTLEHFMGDERKVTLDLMVHYVLQRLNAQKWLVRN